MIDTNTGRTPPAILVLVEVIRDFRTVDDPDGLGRLLFLLEQCLSGEKYEPPKTGGELNTFNRLLAAARNGIATFQKMSNRGKAGAEACNAKRAKQAQAANPSGGERRGGAKAIGDCLGNLGSLLGAGGGMEDMINADPVKAALQITGETGDKRAENTLKKYLREKGESPFRETLFAFNSELKNGEEPRNRGQALNARLRDLPDISKGART